MSSLSDPRMPEEQQSIGADPQIGGHWRKAQQTMQRLNQSLASVETVELQSGDDLEAASAFFGSILGECRGVLNLLNSCWQEVQNQRRTTAADAKSAKAASSTSQQALANANSLHNLDELRKDQSTLISTMAEIQSSISSLQEKPQEGVSRAEMKGWQESMEVRFGENHNAMSTILNQGIRGVQSAIQADKQEMQDALRGGLAALQNQIKAPSNQPPSHIPIRKGPSSRPAPTQVSPTRNPGASRRRSQIAAAISPRKNPSRSKLVRANTGGQIASEDEELPQEEDEIAVMTLRNANPRPLPSTGSNLPQTPRQLATPRATGHRNPTTPSPITPSDVEVPSMEEFLRLCDAYHHSARNDRCAASELPEPVLTAIRPQLEFFLSSPAVYGAAIVPQTKKQIACARAKGGRTRGARFASDRGPCPDCIDRNLVCVRRCLGNPRPLLVPVCVDAMVDDQTWADPSLWTGL